MTFKIGDKVRIKSNLKEFQTTCCISEPMLFYAGKEGCVIRNVDGYYYLEGNNYYWKEEVLEPINKLLDITEYNYLLNIIKPFINDVAYIVKRNYLLDDNFQYMVITINSPVIDEPECISLPYFKKGTMYKGMETDVRYTPEELGFIRYFNGKAVCIEANGFCTVGKIYEFKNGVATLDNGAESVKCTSIEELNRNNGGYYKFLKIVED